MILVTQRSLHQWELSKRDNMLPGLYFVSFTDTVLDVMTPEMGENSVWHINFQAVLV
jgi:hypothetical protein